MANQRGTLMIAVLLLTTLLGGWLGAGLARSATEHRASLMYTHASQALHLAEAGLEQAIENLRTIDGNDDVYAGTLPTGTFTIDQPLTVLDALLYEAKIHGTARDNVEQSIEAILQVTPLSLFRYAMFGDDGVTVGGSAEVDSYDSRLGPYDPVDNSDGNGNIGTNGSAVGDLTLNGDSLFIDGQLRIGPGVADPEANVVGFDDVLVSADPPVVSGSEYPLPAVKIPEGVSCSDLTLTGNTVWTLSSPGTYCFSELSVKAGATLTSDGPVTIYLTESLDFEGHSTIGVADDPSQFLFLMESGSDVDIEGALEGTTDFYGALYGPDASIDVSGNAVIYGSVIGDEVTMSGSSQLHYDEALADLAILSNEGVVEIILWRPTL